MERMILWRSIESEVYQSQLSNWTAGFDYRPFLYLSTAQRASAVKARPFNRVSA